MKKIIVPDYFSKRTKTLIRFLNYIFVNEVQPSTENAEAFLETYIPEAKEFITKYTEGDLRKLSSIKFMSGKENELELDLEEKEESVRMEAIRQFGGEKPILEETKTLELFSFIEEKILSDKEIEYLKKIKKECDMEDVACNLCTILAQIDYEYSENKGLFEAIELGEYEEAYIKLRDKVMSLIVVSNGVTNYVMSINRNREERLDTSKHYIITPDINKGIIGQRDIQLSKKIDRLIGDTDCFMSDVLLFFELITVKHKTDILKFVLALVCIYKSFEYEQYMRDYAKILIDILQEILFGGEIYKIYIQMKQYEQDIPIEERGSQNATTRFSIIFSAYNDDIYYLRIDLPHKGEMKLHLNLHECVRQELIPMGYPLDIDIDIIKKLKAISGGEFDNIFFMVGGKIWFRTDFEKKLKVANISEMNKRELRLIFYEQSHYVLDCNYEKTNMHIAFLEELKEYIVSFGLTGSVLASYDKNTLDIVSEIKKIRILQMFYVLFSEEVIKSDNEPIVGNEAVWDILEAFKCIDNIEKDSFLKLSLYECFEVLGKHII